MTNWTCAQRPINSRGVGGLVEKLGLVVVGQNGTSFDSIRVTSSFCLNVEFSLPVKVLLTVFMLNVHSQLFQVFHWNCLEVFANTMTSPCTEFLQRIWQQTLSSVYHQFKCSDQFLSNPSRAGMLVDRNLDLIGCPCLLTHAFFSPQSHVKKRKRKRRKKRKNLASRSEIAIVHSVR